MKTLEERFWSKVEKGDGCWLWTGYKRPNGYGEIYRRDPRVEHDYAHRVSYELHKGAIPRGMYVDHMCHNTSCVNPSHLRIATPKQNVENHPGRAQSNSRSKVRGVSRCKQTGRWAASVVHGGKKYWLGRFSSLAEAEAAALAKRNELFTHNDADRRVA